MKAKLYTLLIAGLLTAMTGCATSGNEGTQSGKRQGDYTARQAGPETGAGIGETARDVAVRLKQLAESIPQVESAHVVVMGKTAIVGINVKPDLERSRVDSIKYTVAEALQKDPYGVNAVVTADLDLQQRIREISEDVQNGRPIAGFAEELGDIIGRIMPQFPRDIAPQHPEPAPTPQNQQNIPQTGSSKQQNSQIGTR